MRRRVDRAKECSRVVVRARCAQVFPWPGGGEIGGASPCSGRSWGAVFVVCWPSEERRARRSLPRSGPRVWQHLPWPWPRRWRKPRPGGSSRRPSALRFRASVAPLPRSPCRGPLCPCHSLCRAALCPTPAPPPLPPRSTCPAKAMMTLRRPPRPLPRLSRSSRPVPCWPAGCLLATSGAPLLPSSLPDRYPSPVAFSASLAHACCPWSARLTTVRSCTTSLFLAFSFSPVSPFPTAGAMTGHISSRASLSVLSIKHHTFCCGLYVIYSLVRTPRICIFLRFHRVSFL